MGMFSNLMNINNIIFTLLHASHIPTYAINLPQSHKTTYLKRNERKIYVLSDDILTRTEKGYMKRQRV